MKPLTIIVLITGMRSAASASTVSMGARADTNNSRGLKTGSCIHGYSLEFFDSSSGGSFGQQGNLTQYGETSFWNANQVFNQSSPGDVVVGLSSGTCIVVAEPSDDNPARQFCTLYLSFISGSFQGSTLVSEGLYDDEQADQTGSSFTITGGTRCFAGVAGIVKEQYDPVTDGFLLSISFE